MRSVLRPRRLSRPNTIRITGQVWSKRYSVKLLKANSTPTVISVMGPRTARIIERSLPLMAHLPGRSFAARKAAPQQVRAGGDQEHRPIARHSFEVEQVERMEE